MKPDELAARLLAMFQDELFEQVRVLNADLLALEQDNEDPERLRSVFRVVHTLKGAARAAGVPLVEDVCHRLESFLVGAREGRASLGAQEFTLLFAAADGLADAGRRLRAGEPLDGGPLAELAVQLRGDAPLPEPGSVAPRVPRDTVAPATTEEAAQPGAPTSSAAVRISGDKVDALLGATTELLIATGRAQGHATELRTLHESVVRQLLTWRRSSGKLRQVLSGVNGDSQTVELLRETEERFRAIVEDLTRFSTDVDGSARALASVTGQINERVRSLRLRPFVDACETLPRAVRDVATATGREVRLVIEDNDVEADRAVLQELSEALLHLVRNAVDHGIEPPDERERAGKPREGSLRITAALKGDRLAVTVEDDGAGLPVAALRRQLAERGIPVPSSDRELVRRLFQGGVSTRQEATEISGRGVGLDAVRAVMDRVRGSVDVEWTAGAGTCFSLEAPLTLATVRALLVAIGPHLLAIPTSRVLRIVRARRDELGTVEDRKVVMIDGRAVPIASLAGVLGPPFTVRPAGDQLALVILTAGDRRLGLMVDELIAEQDVVVRRLSRIGGRSSPHASGAALLSSGRVAIVLNASTIVASGLSAATDVPIVPDAPLSTSRRRVLVADDSITTRTLEESVLEAAGYDVITAVDGAEAWRLVQERGCDLIVSDVEMPRMDGFALCRAVRSSKRFRELPVILVTGLDSPEDRERGLEAGADAYLVKSSFDQGTLLDTVRDLLG